MHVYTCSMICKGIPCNGVFIYTLLYGMLFFLSQTFAYIYKQKTWIDICMTIRKIYVLCIMCNVLYLWFYQVYAMYTWYFCKYNFCIYLWVDPVDICREMSKNITSPVSMDICKDERFAYIYSEFDGYMQLLTINARLRCPSAWLYWYQPMHCDRSYLPHDLLCIYLYVQLVVQQFQKLHISTSYSVDICSLAYIYS